MYRKPTDVQIITFYNGVGFKRMEKSHPEDRDYDIERSLDDYYWKGQHCCHVRVDGFVPPIDLETLLTQVIRECAEEKGYEKWHEDHCIIKPYELFALLVRWHLKVVEGGRPCLGLVLVDMGYTLNCGGCGHRSILFGETPKLSQFNGETSYL